MESKAQLLSKYHKFCITATALSVVFILVLGAFAISVNAFPESGLADFFTDRQRGIFRALLFLPILLGCSLVLLKLPKNFFRDPQIASSLNDERTAENSGKAYRNAFFAVLLIQVVATPLFVSSTSSTAIWMLALTTALTGIITFIVSYSTYEWL